MMKRWLAAATLMVVAAALSAQEEKMKPLDAREVETTIRRVGDWTLQNPEPFHPLHWAMPPLYDGLIDASLVTSSSISTALPSIGRRRELTRAGLRVVGLERGEPRHTVPDFQAPGMHDELRYATRKALMQDAAKETLTFRHAGRETVQCRSCPLRATTLMSSQPCFANGGGRV
jgi:hypothetical protein